MTKEKLNDILEAHKLWLADDPNGRYTNLRYADLSGADLRRADLIYADLNGANLRYADLRRADLSDTNLSGAKGLLSTINFMEAHFERFNDGYIAYKTFRQVYQPPEKWKIEPNAILEETVNYNRTNACGSGINVATLKWVEKNYPGEIWKVLIKWEWLCGVCVPYNTDGKIRCERVQLLEIV